MLKMVLREIIKIFHFQKKKFKMAAVKSSLVGCQFFNHDFNMFQLSDIV